MLQFQKIARKFAYFFQVGIMSHLILYLLLYHLKEPAILSLQSFLIDSSAFPKVIPKFF